MSKAKKKTVVKTKLFDISILFFLMVVVVIPNVYFKHALDKQLDVRLFAIALFLFIAVVHLIFSKKTKTLSFDFNVFKTPPVLLYFAYVLLVVASYFWATNKTEANYEILKTTTFFILFIYTILFVVPKEKSRDSVVLSFIVLGIILSIIGLVQLKEAIDEFGFGVETAYKVTGSNAHKNIFSQVLFLAFSFSAYGLFLFKDFRKKLAFISTLLTLILILSLMTRSVWVALITGTFVVLIVYFIFIKKEIPFKKIKKFLIIGGAIIAFSLVLFTFLSGFDSNKEIEKHISSSFKFKEGNVVHRFDLWKKSIPMIKENTILGVGAGNWKIDILKYDVTLSRGKMNIVPRRTHNDYISVLTETGVLGLLIYLSFFVLIFFYAIKYIKKSETYEDKLFGLSLLFAFVGYSTYSLFSFPKERIETQILFNIVLAFIIQRSYSLSSNKKKTKKSKLLKPIATVSAVLLFLAVLSGYYRTNAEVKINKIYSLQRSTKISNEEKLRIMYQLTEEALSPFSTITPFSEPIVKMQAGILFQQNADFDEVVAKYKEALVEIPYHIKTLLELSQLYYNNEDYENAVLYSAEAYEYAPKNMNVLIAYVYFKKAAGYGDEAYEILITTDTKKNDKRYKDLLFSFLNEKTIDIANDVDNLLVKQKLFNKSQKQEVLLDIYSYSAENEVVFEKELLYRTLKEINNSDSLIIDASLDSLIKNYNIELDF